MTVETAIQKIENLEEMVAQIGISIMKEEVPKRTGALQRSVHADIGQGSVNIVAGNSEVNYAAIINNGRGEVRPRYKRSLHWIDKGDVFSMRSGPVAPNNYVERTLARLRQINFNQYF